MFRQLNLLLMMSCLLPGCISAARLERLMAERKSQSSMKGQLIDDLSSEDLGRLAGKMLVVSENQHAEAKPTAGTPPSSTASDYVVLESKELKNLHREFLREQIINTPRGSQVGIHDASGGRYTGTVLRAGPDCLEMMNCISQEVVPGPDGQQQCKTSHIPFQRFQTSAVTHFIAISPPPASFPASDDEIDGTEYSVAEIVNRSGQRQRWGRPPVQAESH